MLAKVSITIDCLGRPAICEISSVIRTGEDELDLLLFSQMAVAVRRLADAANADQERILDLPEEVEPATDKGTDLPVPVGRTKNVKTD